MEGHNGNKLYIVTIYCEAFVKQI